MADTGHPGLIVRQKAPLNLEFQFSSLSELADPERPVLRAQSLPDAGHRRGRLAADGRRGGERRR